MFHGHNIKVTLLTLFLVLSFLSCGRICSVVGGESSSSSSDRESRDYDISTQLGSSAAATLQHEESIRKEMIKVQILTRLGLSEKPHVDKAHKISKDLVLEAFRRTENLDQDTPFTSRHSGHHHFNSTSTADTDENSNFAKTSEIIAFPDKGPVLNGHTLLSFSYAGNNAYGVGVRVKKAHLWVKMEYMSSIGRHFGHILHPKGVNLYIFQVNGNFSHNGNSQHETVHLSGQEVNLDLVVSRTVMLDSLGWQKLDITPVVQKWYNKHSRHRVRHANSHKNHKEKLTLLVDCAGCGYSILPITFSQANTVIKEKSVEEESQNERTKSDPDLNLLSRRWNQKESEGEVLEESQIPDTGKPDSVLMSELNLKIDNITEVPFLVLETESSPNSKRSRRRALECSPRVKQCCKQRFYVSFGDLGWDDWIIAPKGYYANYCKGHCGGPYRTPDTFLNYHTHVLEEYRRTSDGQVNLEGITPCCAPTKFSSISLIYFGPDLNIIKRDLPKMIVEECGCP